MPTVAFIPALFIHTFAAILTGIRRAFVDVNRTVVVHDVIITTAACHAAVDAEIRSHKLSPLIGEFGAQCTVNVVPAP